jgi:hypothetical protein
MSGESESVVGEIPVVARLALGVERLSLFVTDTRMIVAHLGKRGAGAYATSALFGRLSGGFEDVVKSGRESWSKRGLQTISPEKILAAHKDNFQLRFGEIVSVRLVETRSARQMSVLTRDSKFEFQTDHPIDSIVGLLQIPLGSKLAVERPPEGVYKNREH